MKRRAQSLFSLPPRSYSGVNPIGPASPFGTGVSDEIRQCRTSSRYRSNGSGMTASQRNFLKGFRAGLSESSQSCFEMRRP